MKKALLFMTLAVVCTMSCHAQETEKLFPHHIGGMRLQATGTSHSSKTA